MDKTKILIAYIMLTSGNLAQMAEAVAFFRKLQEQM